MTGKIRRWRDYHWYGADGRRYLDLGLDEGGAFCGHRPSSLLSDVKQILSRGGLVGCVNRETERSFKHMLQLLSGIGLADALPGYRVALLPPGLSLDQIPCVLPAGIDGFADTRDPRLRSAQPVLLWRPGYNAEDTMAEGLKAVSDSLSAGRRPLVAPVLPVPRSLCPQPLFVPQEIEDSPLMCSDWRGQARFSELSLRSLVLGIQLFLRPEYPAWSRKRSDLHWFARGFKSRGFDEWYSSGPYQYFSGTRESYELWKQAAAQLGLLIPESPVIAAVIPSVLSSTEDELIDSLPDVLGRLQSGKDSITTIL